MRSARPLTPRQQQTLLTIQAFFDHRGHPPTLREIGAAMDIKSTNGVQDHIDALVRKGFVERRAGFGQSRNFYVVRRIDQDGIVLPASKRDPKTVAEIGRDFGISRAAFEEVMGQMGGGVLTDVPLVDGHVVYFVQSVVGGPIKIGTTGDIGDRMANLQIGSPLPLKVIALIRGNASTEAALHDRFAKSRLHGEWFFPAEDLVDYIRGLVRFAEPMGGVA